MIYATGQLGNQEAAIILIKSFAIGGKCYYLENELHARKMRPIEESSAWFVYWLLPCWLVVESKKI